MTPRLIGKIPVRESVENLYSKLRWVIATLYFYCLLKHVPFVPFSYFPVGDGCVWYAQNQNW